MQNDDYNNVEAIVSTSKNKARKRSIAERNLDFNSRKMIDISIWISFVSYATKDIFIHADSLNLVVCN